MDIYSIIGIVSANTIVLAILAFLAKSIITHWLNKDVAKFKIEVEQKAKESISSYQSELEKERIRLQVSYAGIFEKQANVIIELYKLLVKFDDSVDFATYSDGDDDYKIFLDNWRSLVIHFEENRILIPESVDVFIENFHRNVFSGVDGYRRLERQINKQYGNEEQREKLFDRQDKINGELDKIPALKKELSNKLRGIIGITE